MSRVANRWIGAALRGAGAGGLVPSLQAARFTRRARRLYVKYHQHTMIPAPIFIENLRLVARWRGMPGAVVECGVWKGGMMAAMAEILGPDRDYALFDSFEGLPEATPADGAWAAKRLATAAQHPRGRIEATMEDATAAMARSGTPFTCIKGWFQDTLPGWVAPAPIAVLRLDADLYESTRDSLTALYPQVAPGGLILFDDYYGGWDGCPRAVHEYLVQLPVVERMRQSPGGVAYLIKGHPWG